MLRSLLILLMLCGAAGSAQAEPLPPCLPGLTCEPGAVVSVRLTALSPEDAREALTTVRLLEDSEAREQRCREELAEVRAELRALQVVPVVVAEGQGGGIPVAVDPVASGVARLADTAGSSTWSTRLIWGMGGLAVGVLLGTVLVLGASGG